MEVTKKDKKKKLDDLLKRKGMKNPSKFPGSI